MLSHRIDSKRKSCKLPALKSMFKFHNAELIEQEKEIKNYQTGGKCTIKS